LAFGVRLIFSLSQPAVARSPEGEARGRAQLVFQFIENIFVIAAIAIQLAVAREFLVK
jgi:hypothetical protein